MEGLKKLEEIQKMLMFMESESFIFPDSTSSGSDSHRFLAHFLLFLMEPCGKLSIDDKCSLISQHLSQISPSFLEKAMVILPEKQTSVLGDLVSVKENTDEGRYGSGHISASDDVALIGLDAMQRANSTLEDFCRSYFMFHGMDVERPDFIFKYLPVLSFTESYIYQLDTLNEKMVSVTTNKVSVQDGIANDEAYSAFACRFSKVFESDPFWPLMRLLQNHRLLTESTQD